MSAPAYIEGYWAKGNPTPNSGLVSYHVISAEIPEDAEAKIRVMDNYYKNYHRNYGTIEVIVDGPRVRVFYSKSCVDMYDNCNPRRNADPNGWVIRSPDNITDVVVLFDGVGESSATPFPDSYFSRLEQRLEFKENSANQTNNPD
ncbi:hypothetical protein [Vibrio sp. 99-8-1]|uniref:hypothetical protein n=1 Tax=Vibrio sp. 99-8-1 TaxID=2607602 RepID=UPI0014939F2E|nr:hypothetical protein [Vibrio sp. 99-8-1]NOI65117.1 hypothetical protein [Vibrio sp. 99-8-1]